MATEIQFLLKYSSLLPGIIVTNSYSVFGLGSGDIWIENPQCTGNENNIFDCRTSPSLGSRKISTVCNHFEDVGIRCYSDNRSPTTSKHSVYINSQEYYDLIDLHTLVIAVHNYY